MYKWRKLTKEPIAKGQQGCIFECICDEFEDTFIMKEFSKKKSISMFLKEVDHQRKAYGMGVAPRIVDIHIPVKKNVEPYFVME